MNLNLILYVGLISAILAWIVPLLETTFRRVLFGLCFGLIAATAFPFLESYLLTPTP